MVNKVLLLLLVEGIGVMTKSVDGSQWIIDSGAGMFSLDGGQLLFVPHVSHLIDVLVVRLGGITHPKQFLFSIIACFRFDRRK